MCVNETWVSSKQQFDANSDAMFVVDEMLQNFGSSVNMSKYILYNCLPFLD